MSQVVMPAGWRLVKFYFLAVECSYQKFYIGKGVRVLGLRISKDGLGQQHFSVTT